MLSTSPQLARSALDAAPDAMIIIDDAGVIRFANRQVSALFGYAHDDLIGRPVECLLPERFRDRHPAERLAYARNRRVRPMGTGLELFGRRSDGSEFPVEISLSPIEDEESGRALVAAAIRDVTDHKSLESALRTQLQEMRRLHELSSRLVGAIELPNMLEEILDATIGLQGANFGNIRLYDPDSASLRIVAQRGFSQAFLEQFRLIASSDDSTCARALKSRSRIVIDDVEKDGDYGRHRAAALQEGFRAVQSTPIVSRNGDVLGILSTYFRQPHVPSERNFQLTDLYMRLAADVIARARDEQTICAARDAADRANRAKSRFLAAASHDLRQPVQTLAFLNGILRRVVRESAPSQVLGQQEQAIAAMSRLLTALLDISKLESGAVKPDPSDFAVSLLFDELRHEFASLATHKGISLDVAACEENVHSDPSLVTQILRNLVSNAIKYTRKGWVALRCLRGQSGQVRIEVLDTGIGIPADQLGLIYDEFFQVGVPANKTRDGYGLGLSIVQRLVRLLNAQIEVSSEVGKGSVFTLTLPAARGTARPITRAVESLTAAEHARARILLVEDDPAVRNATRMLLRSDGYRVRTAASLREALAHTTRDPEVDLLITDYHLDGETGTQVVAALRERLGRPLKAVLMTGDTSREITELPPDPLRRIASKPVNAEELLGLLRDLLAP